MGKYSMLYLEKDYLPADPNRLFEVHDNDQDPVCR